MYRRHVYPRVHKFLRNVFFLMSQINELDQPDVFTRHIERLTDNYRDCKKEGRLLEFDHVYVAARFKTLSKKMSDARTQLENEIVKICQGGGVIRIFAQLFSGNATKSRDEVALLQQASECMDKLKDCCERVRALVRYVNEQVGRVGLDTDKVGHYMNNAAEAEEDKYLDFFQVDQQLSNDVMSKT